jgi:hypothetical protein
VEITANVHSQQKTSETDSVGKRVADSPSADKGTDQFGKVIANAGDIDEDGTSNLATGVPSNDVAGSDSALTASIFRIGHN